MTDVIADSTDITTAAGTIQASAKGTYGSLSNVLAVDDITANLLSISEATRPGYVAVFTRDEFKLMKSDDVYITGTPLISGKQANGVYEADIPATPLPHMESALVADARIDNEFELWHRRFGHCSVRTLKDTMRSVTGMSFPKTHIKHFHAKGICHGCAVGKLDKKPVRRHELKKQLPVQMKPGGLFVMDLLTSPTKSFGGNYYALIIVDAATRYAWAYFLPNKSDATVGVQQWLKTLKQYGIRTETFTTVRTDNGGEFLNSEFLETLQEAGIKRELSPPYGHVYMAERAIRTLQSNARAMMATEGLSAGFWAEALAYAVYTYNRLVSKSCKSKTKYELFFGVKPDVSNLRLVVSSMLVNMMKFVRSGIPRHLEVDSLVLTKPRLKRGRYSTCPTPLSPTHLMLCLMRLYVVWRGRRLERYWIHCLLTRSLLMLMCHLRRSLELIVMVMMILL